MKRLILLLALFALPQIGCTAPYFRVGFNRVSGGVFLPMAGAFNDKQAGFIVPVLEHAAQDGFLLIPGVSWNLLNLGYVGSISNFDEFSHGKVALGPSLQTGDLAKEGLRFLCRAALPKWGEADHYELMKAALAPGGEGVYIDIGMYQAIKLNAVFPLNKIQPESLFGASLVKKFGGPTK